MSNERELKRAIKTLIKEKKITKAEGENLIGIAWNYADDEWRKGAREGFQRG